MTTSPRRPLVITCVVAVLTVTTTIGDATRVQVPGQAVPAASATVSLAGEWKFLPYEGPANLGDLSVDDGDWPTMTIPSNWFLQGRREYPVDADLTPAPRGQIGDWREYGRPQPERGFDYAGTVWFRRRIDRPVASGDERIIVRFEMVDYFADVYIDGRRVGGHEGYFQPFEFDITPHLQDGRSLLAVRVGAPALIYDWHERYPIGWPKRQSFVKGIFGYHDTRPGGTTDRGQERGTGGIIGAPSLRVSSGVDLSRVEVAPLEVSDASATLRIEYVLRNWSDRARPATIRGEVRGRDDSRTTVDRFEQTVTAEPGESRVRITRMISRPRLWWTWDLGTPYLYELYSRLDDSGQASRTDRFGIRSIRRDAASRWYLNGRRLFPRGSNYIATQWLSQADRAWYERDVKMMVAANLNTIRVHAHVERPEFYDVADELGIMVWQDFPLQWGYTDAAFFQRSALTQLRDMVGLFFNHPSIIVWCMQNEAPHAMEWMRRKVQNQNLALDEALLVESQRLDPTRVHHRDSGSGDGHPYPGWYGGRAADYARLPGAPFITEYGAQALPGLETLKTMFPPAVLWPDTPADWDVWTFHNFQRRETFETTKIDMGSNIEAFIANSQRYQAALLKFATETYRRAKWSRVTGIYQFMFVENWPSITWAVVDYYRRPKRGYTALQTAMQPVLPSIEYAVDDPSRPVALWIVNDHPREYPRVRLRWRIGGRDQTRAVDVAADSAQKIVDLGDARAIGLGSDRLEVWLEDADGRPLGHNALEAADFLQAK